MNSPSPKRSIKWPHGSRINMEAMMRISVRGDDSVIEHSVNLCEKLRLDFLRRDLPKHEFSTHLCWSEKIAVLIHQRGDRTRGKNRCSLTQIQVNSHIQLWHTRELPHCVFGRGLIDHEGSAGEDPIEMSQQDSVRDAMTETQIIRIDDEALVHCPDPV